MVRRKGLPKENELVICTVENVTQFAAWVKLDEYPLDGIIHISEVVGKWISDIRQYVKVGEKHVARVIGIEPEKNLVTLSLRRVSKKERKDRMNQFRKDQRAEKLLEIAAKSIGKSLDEAWEEVGYLLQDKFGDLYEAFKQMVKMSEEDLKKIGVSEKWATALVETAKASIKEKKVSIKFELEIKSYSPDGIEKIKNLLKDLQTKTKAEVKYLSAPLYRLEIETTEPKEKEKKILKVLEQFSKSKDPLITYKKVEA